MDLLHPVDRIEVDRITAFIEFPFQYLMCIIILVASSSVISKQFFIALSQFTLLKIYLAVIFLVQGEWMVVKLCHEAYK